MILGKVMEQLVLITTGNSHHGFTKGKSFLNNLMNFNNEMTGLTEERRSVDIVYPDFSHRITES